MVKNVIIVNDKAYVNGGAGKVAISSVIALAERGYHVVLFAASGPVSTELRSSNVEVILTGQNDILSEPNRFKAICQGVWSRKARKMFAELLDRFDENETVIHFHGWIKALSVSIFEEVVGRNFKLFLTLHDFFLYCPNGGLYDYQEEHICERKPMSLSCKIHNCDSRNMMQKQWRVLRQVVHNHEIEKVKDKITFISISGLTERMFKRYMGDKLKLVRINNPIDDTLPLNLDLKERDSYLFVARLSPEKGLDLFCEAITRLKLKGIVLGDGDLYTEYKERYKNIHFAGWVDGKIKGQYIEKAKCLVFASRWYETYGLSVAEFLSYGIPCIVPDKCAASENIVEGKNGYIFESGNLKSLISSIQRMEESNLVAKNRSIAEDFCMERHNLEMHVNKLIAVYNTDDIKDSGIHAIGGVNI